MLTPWQIAQLGLTSAYAVACLALARVESQRGAAIAGAAPRRPLRGEGSRRFQVAGDGGTWVNLGTSPETYQALSASPGLEGGAVDVRSEAGDPFRIPAGTPLQIAQVYGARRRVLESITTPRGVTHVFSFEVEAGTWLWIDAQVEEPGGAGAGPFRDSGPRALRPVGDTITVSGEKIVPGAPPPTAAAAPGCWVAVVIVALIATFGGYDFLFWPAAVGGGALFCLLVLALPPAVKARET